MWEELAAQQVVEGQEIRFTARSSLCTIAAGDLNFKLLADAPRGATLDANTGEFVWTPTEAQGPQEYAFTIMAVATEEGRAPVVHEREVTVRVEESVDKPMFAMPEPIEGTEHEKLTYQIDANDPNLPAIGLRYDLPKPLPGMTIDRDRVKLAGLPANSKAVTPIECPFASTWTATNTRTNSSNAHSPFAWRSPSIRP